MKTKKLTLIQATPEQARNTCGPYWYLVQDYYTSHTAFCRRESFLNYLEERGLALSEPLVEQGTYAYQVIIGGYDQVMHMSYDAFYALPAIIETRTLSNGSYTLARITEDNGIRTVHTLNPNCEHRPEYDYFESKAIYG